MMRRAGVLALWLTTAACGSSSHEASPGVAGANAAAGANGGSTTGGNAAASGAGNSGASGGAAGIGLGGAANAGSAGVPSGGAAPSGRTFPDTNASIGILADQLPTLNDAQMDFVVSHYVG